MSNFMLTSDVNPFFYYSVVSRDRADYSGFRFQQWVASMFFGTNYLIGFTSMQPQSTAQVLSFPLCSHPSSKNIYGLLIVIVGAGYFATIIGTVSALLQGMDQADARFKEKLDLIKNYMQFRRIDSQLQNDIRGFYTQLQRSKRHTDDDVIGDLEIGIKRDISRDLLKDLVSKVPLFHQCGEMFVEEICIYLKHTLLLKNYYIFRKGEIGKEMYFIGSGSVQVVNDDGTVVFATIGKGSFFGEIALTSPDARRTASIRAAELCELYVLYKTDFENVVNKYSEAKEAIRSVIEARKQDLEKKKRMEENAKLHGSKKKTKGSSLMRIASSKKMLKKESFVAGSQ